MLNLSDLSGFCLQLHCLLFSHSVLSDSSRPHGLQHTEGSLSFTVSWSLLKLMSVELMPSKHFILHHTLFLPTLLASIRVFSSESALCIRWPEYQSFSISPSSEYSGMFSFRMDWLDLLAVEGTFRSLFQHHSWSINYLGLSLLYGPVLTSLHDYWKTIQLRVYRPLLAK